MQNATLQQRLVFNVIAKEATFRAAESVAEIMLADENNIINAAREQNFTTGVSTTVVLPDNRVTLQGTMRSAGTGPARGYSTSFQAHRFTITGVSTIADVHTSTTVEQGVEQVMPSGL